MATDKNWEPRSLGHGYVEGPDAYRITRVSKARKRFDCYGPLRRVRDTDDISPGTGDAISCEKVDDCTSYIEPGELYVYILPHDLDVYQSYWTAHRMCLKCALKENTIKQEHQVSP